MASRVVAALPHVGRPLMFAVHVSGPSLTSLRLSNLMQPNVGISGDGPVAANIAGNEPCSVACAPHLASWQDCVLLSVDYHNTSCS
jgi:hypothetical protein